MKIEKDKFVDFLHNHYYIYASKVTAKGDYVSFSFTANDDYLVKRKKSDDRGFVSSVVYAGCDVDKAIKIYNQLIGS